MKQLHLYMQVPCRPLLLFRILRHLNQSRFIVSAWISISYSRVYAVAGTRWSTQSSQSLAPKKPSSHPERKTDKIRRSCLPGKRLLVKIGSMLPSGRFPFIGAHRVTHGRHRLATSAGAGCETAHRFHRFRGLESPCRVDPNLRAQNAS